ncbi:hypothetical protein [Streptomyces alboniger]|uniref:DUF732 domain-containing protein n=1 Tax=Streptomyces alboniger TaxID=132473 RepID=A0A5J6HYT0_STRAD|nr:hypothetical protein [Streptomyces alboniger]QEV21755.1 hypothetical protein CP975_33335 [Streptomyces alboniger]
MYKRLPVLALCLATAALGISACDDSGDNRSGAPARAASTAPPSPESPSAASSGDDAKPRQLTGAMPAFFLKTIRDHYPDMDNISDEKLLAHGNAFCAAEGQALADQAKKTMKELGTTPKQTARIMGSAHGYCRLGSTQSGN